MNKRLYIILVWMYTLLSIHAENIPVYRNSDFPVEQRVEDLLR